MAELGAAEIAKMTAGLDGNQKMIFQSQYSSEKKDRGTGIILALFLFDRLWLGDTALGIMKYLTLGGCGIWGLVDLFTVGNRCDDHNRAKASEIVASLRL